MICKTNNNDEYTVKPNGISMYDTLLRQARNKNISNHTRQMKLTLTLGFECKVTSVQGGSRVWDSV